MPGIYERLLAATADGAVETVESGLDFPSPGGNRRLDFHGGVGFHRPARAVAMQLARDSSTLGHRAGGPLQTIQTARATNRGASAAAETPPCPSRIAPPLEQGQRPRSGDRWTPRGANSPSSSTPPDTPAASVINAARRPKSFDPRCDAPGGDPSPARCPAATSDRARSLGDAD